VTAGSIGILATGSYVPDREISNQELADRVGVDPVWIETRTHVLTRRYAAADEATSDLAAHAVARALAQAGLTVDAVDYLIVSTSTGDHPQPPTANLVQHALGAWNAACFDLNAVCSGFVYGLGIARALTTTNPGTHAVVVAADLYSRFVDFSDARSAVLFGDGAGAAVVGRTSADGFVRLDLRSRGDQHALIRVPAGGSREPTSPETYLAGGHLFRMRGREVRDFVTRELPPVLADLLDGAGVAPGDVDHFVPHQANGVLIQDLALKAGLDTAQTHRTVERYGNIGSASIAVTLDEANRSGALRSGDLVLLAAFGGGMSIGACLLRWQSTPS
jgi:acetoacetyl-CoA synthase